MADGLSIAASAVQVADAGFKLYGALSRYIKDYRDANKHSKRLAEEVRTTSWALQQLGLLLQVDGDLKLCKPEVIDETAAALKGCENAFNEVSEIIEGSIPAVKNGGGASMPMSVRLKWPFKKSKVQLLLAQLERLKTTLMLVFKVLEYASKIASTCVKPLSDDEVPLALTGIASAGTPRRTCYYLTRRHSSRSWLRPNNRLL